MDYDNLNIGENSCCHYDLSEIKKHGDKIYFPFYYLEDYYLDLFEELNIDYNEKNGKIYVNAKDIGWELLYLTKCHIYSAIVWYPCLSKYTMKSELIEITSNIKDVLEQANITFPKFIKLDTVSAKDVSENNIYYNISQVENIFMSSQRILNTIESRKKNYLFIREINWNIVNKNGIELRVFVYNLKITAICGGVYIKEDDKIIILELIKKFFINVLEDLPYRDSVVDIFIHDNKKEIIIIELNNFGADSPAGAGLYNWKDDYDILYNKNNNKIDFRTKDEYEF